MQKKMDAKAARTSAIIAPAAMNGARNHVSRPDFASTGKK
jgi:hypothetical protein